MSGSGKHIVLCISGSVAAYKAASLASLLGKDGHEVQCVATEKALEFIGPSALEGVTRRPVESSMFSEPHRINHISLADWADLIILYPASATTIARLAAGTAEDLVSALFLANNFRVPYLVTPAMNSNMLAHPAVVRNLETLASWGARILPTEEGALACGVHGSGRLISPERTASFIRSSL